jgi:hypothetical protein
MVIVCAISCYIVVMRYDEGSGKVFQIHAVITDKNTRMEQRYEQSGITTGGDLVFTKVNVCFYRLYYKRKDGVEAILDTTKESYDSVPIGQPIVVTGLVGGFSGREYISDIVPYSGPEMP